MMRRASTFMAVLGLGALGLSGPDGRRLGGADGHGEGGDRADPEEPAQEQRSDLPRHRRHPRRSRRAGNGSQNQRDRIRRLPLARQADQGDPAQGHEAERKRLREVLGDDPARVRPRRLPAQVDRQRSGRSQRRRQLRQRTRARESLGAGLLQPGRRTGLLDRRDLRPSRSKNSRRSPTPTPRLASSPRRRCR